MLKAIIDAIENLPPVPNVVKELQEMYYLDAYNAADVERVIKKDPALVANILKIANSPLYEFTREIVDIRQAIVLFGLDKIIEFALASFINELITFDLDLYAITSNDFLRLAQRKSAIASQLIENKKERFIVSNTAFLADVAKIIISNYVKKEKKSLLVEENLSLNQLDERERELFGFDTIEVSALIFDRWNFEENMVGLIKDFKKRKSNSHKAVFIAREILGLKANLIRENLEQFEEAVKLQL